MIGMILPGLKNAKIFSVLDARKGFWQVELDTDSSKLTTFAILFSRYCWKRPPFEIASAPEEYQRWKGKVGSLPSHQLLWFLALP